MLSPTLLQHALVLAPSLLTRGLACCNVPVCLVLFARPAPRAGPHACNHVNWPPCPCCPCLQVKTLTGKEIEIDIEPTDTVQRIKERVEEKEGIPPVQQR